MTALARRLPRLATTLPAIDWRRAAPAIAGSVAFAILFAEPFTTLLHDWLHDPDAGHGLLLGPLALYLAWRRGRAPTAHTQPVAGLVVLVAAVLLRYVSGLAAELFTMRVSLWIAGAGLVVFLAGWAQLRHWWLSAVLLALSVPLPAVVLGTVALPLQLVASRLGAALLGMRHVPVALAGNVIQLPGRSLFVTEACSGLRSLTALVALGILLGVLILRSPWLRVVVLAAAIPVAILVNGLRVFLTGFVVYFVSPAAGEGVMHLTEGWVMFVGAFCILGALSWSLSWLEKRRQAA